MIKDTSKGSPQPRLNMPKEHRKVPKDRDKATILPITHGIDAATPVLRKEQSVLHMDSSSKFQIHMCAFAVKILAFLQRRANSTPCHYSKMPLSSIKNGTSLYLTSHLQSADRKNYSDEANDNDDDNNKNYDNNDYDLTNSETFIDEDMLDVDIMLDFKKSAIKAKKNDESTSTIRHLLLSNRIKTAEIKLHADDVDNFVTKMDLYDGEDCSLLDNLYQEENILFLNRIPDRDRVFSQKTNFLSHFLSTDRLCHSLDTTYSYGTPDTSTTQLRSSNSSMCTNDDLNESIDYFMNFSYDSKNICEEELFWKEIQSGNESNSINSEDKIMFNDTNFFTKDSKEDSCIRVVSPTASYSYAQSAPTAENQVGILDEIINSGVEVHGGGGDDGSINTSKCSESMT